MSDNIQKAIERGNQRKRELAETFLPLEKVCEMIAFPEEEVRKMVEAKSIVAVTMDEKLLFPEWQFTPHHPQRKEALGVDETHFVSRQVIGIWEDLRSMDKKEGSWEFIFFMTLGHKYISFEPDVTALSLTQKVSRAVQMDGEHGCT